MILLTLTGCATGYKLHHMDGKEILYHDDESGTQQIVYVVNKVIKEHIGPNISRERARFLPSHSRGGYKPPAPSHLRLSCSASERERLVLCQNPI